jgi:hypothetical protein
MALIFLYLMLAVAVAFIAMIRDRRGLPWFFTALFLSPLIAGLLVMALPRGRGAYWYADLEHQPLPPGVVPMPADAKIRIIRKLGRDEPRACEIFVNGAEVGIVEPGSIIDFRVPSGRLQVEACIDWAESTPLKVETRPGQRIDIEVANHGGKFLKAWSRAFPTDRYLSLRRLPAATERQAA